MNRYSVHGLVVATETALEELMPAPQQAPVDVTVEFGAEPSWTGEPVVAERYRAQSGDDADRIVVTEHRSGFCFRYGDGSSFDLSRDTRKVWCRFTAPHVVADATVYLLGPILGFILRLRGVLCLHASAVVVDSRAVALVGPAGAGKSTTAGAFAAAGHAVLSDDLVALRTVGDSWIAQPAYPHLRLWNDGERVLFGTAGQLPRLTPTWEKRKLPLSPRASGVAGGEAPAAGAEFEFARTAAPLRAIVFLPENRGAPPIPALVRMPGKAALLSLAGETYANYLLDAPMRRDELAALSALVESIPVWEAMARDDHLQLPELISAIVDTVRAGR
jgi:hypothetical protein